MSETRIIIEDSTETLQSYPPMQYRGAVTDPIVRIGTGAVTIPDEGEEDNATVDPVDASTSAAASKGAETLSFAAPPGITEGNLYELKTPGEPAFMVEAIEADGNDVHLADPLPVAIESGATFRGRAVSHALTAAESANKGRAMAIWTADVNGVSRSWEQPFRIVPRAFRRRLSVPELLKLAPEMLRLRQSIDSTLTEAIDAGYEELFARLEARKFLIDRINSPGELSLPLARLIVWRARGALHGLADENTVAAQRDFQARIDDALASSEWWYDRADEDQLTEEVRSDIEPEEWIEVVT